MIQISKNLYVQTDTPSNVGFLVTKAGVVMIDAPMRPSAAIQMREEAQKQGEIRYCITTEEHHDHWQGNYFYPGVLISSEKVRETLSKLTLDETMGFVKHREPESLPLVANYKIRLAELTFNDRLTLRMGDHTVQMFALPGHTEGGIAVYLPEEGVVFAHDTVNHKCMTRIFPNGDPAKWLTSLQRLGQLNVDVVVPGHGDPCKKEYIPEQIAILQQWIDAAKEGMRQGKSADELAKMTPPDPYPKQPAQNLTPPEIVRMNFQYLYQLYS